MGFPLVPMFPENLMNVLEDEKNNNVIDWNSNGMSFIIKNSKVFVDKVILQFMASCKYSSFVRKLYRWGFRQPDNAKQSQCFYNKLFQRGEKTMCKTMRCHSINKVKDERKIKKSKIKTGLPKNMSSVNRDEGTFAGSSVDRGTNFDKLNYKLTDTYNSSQSYSSSRDIKTLNANSRNNCLLETFATSSNKINTPLVNCGSNKTVNEENRRRKLEEMTSSCLPTTPQNSRYMTPSLDIKTLRDNLLLRSLTSPHVERYILSLSHSQKIEYFNSNHQHLLQELFTIDKVIQIHFQTMQFQNTLQSTKEGARYCESIDCHKNLQTITAAQELKIELVNELSILNLLVNILIVASLTFAGF